MKEDEPLMQTTNSSYGGVSELQIDASIPDWLKPMGRYGLLTRGFIYDPFFLRAWVSSERGQKFLEGVDLSISGLWPMAFTALTIHDLITFAKSSNDYGNSVGKILLGISPDAAMLSSNLGNNRPDQWLPFWGWSSLFLLSPLLTGLGRMFLPQGLSLRQTAFKKQEESLNELHNLTAQNSIVKSLYAQYRLWSIGYPKFSPLSLLLLQPVFWIFNLYLYFCDARILEIFISKIIKFSQYLSNSRCSKGEVYLFLQQLGDYACTVCGDWSFVYWQNVFTSQDCLNGLTATARSSNIIMSSLKRLTIAPNFQSVDFSQQLWTNWTSTEWRGILDQLALGSSQLNNFNLSNTVLNQQLIDDGMLTDLGNFLKKTVVKILDFSNLNAGMSLLKSVIVPANLTALSYLDVSGNQLDDELFLNISTVLPKKTLQTLRVANNLITDQGLEQGCAILADSNISTLDVSYNLIQGANLSSVKPMVAHGQLSSIDFSGNDLSQADLIPFWKIAQNGSSLAAVYLDDVNLSNSQLISDAPYLETSSIRRFSFRNNQITDLGFSQFIYGTVNTSVEEVDFSSNPSITDSGLTTVVPFIAKTNLKAIGLSNLGCTDEGVVEFVPSLANSTIETITLSGNYLGDESAQAVSDLLLESTNPVRQIDLSNNEITTINGSAIAKGKLSVLLLNGNDLSNDTISDISDNLPDSQLELLGLNNVGLDAQGAIELSKAIPKSVLKMIDIGNNPIGDSGLDALGEMLIDPVPAEKSLTDKTISLDLTRWLANKATPNTNLAAINVENTEMTSSAARLFCRVIPGSRILFNNINLTPNNYVDPLQVDLLSCSMEQSMTTPFPVNSGQTNSLQSSGVSHDMTYTKLLGSSLLIGIPMVILALLVLYYLYKILAPRFSSICKHTTHFFQKQRHKVEAFLLESNMDTQLGYGNQM